MLWMKFVGKIENCGKPTNFRRRRKEKPAMKTKSWPSHCCTCKGRSSFTFSAALSPLWCFSVKFLSVRIFAPPLGPWNGYQPPARLGLRCISRNPCPSPSDICKQTKTRNFTLQLLSSSNLPTGDLPSRSQEHFFSRIT